LVLAGAGSGKTRVLTHRLAYLLRDHGVSPWHVMAVTFTNKAAGEMKERAQSLVGGLPRDAWVGTFHSLCARILRRHGHIISIEPSFSIFDDSDQLALVRECLRDLNLDEKHYPPRAILTAIGRAKDELIGPEEFARMAQSHNENVAAQVYRKYQEKLSQSAALDFDDLIMRTVLLLRESPAAAEYYQSLFQHILIDEYQDINTAQYVLVRILAEPQRNLCAVGDDDQSIYAFRGANVRLILNFQKDYPEAKIVKLEQNYRSTKPILDGAWSVVRQNPGRHDKRLWTAREGGDPILVYEASDEHDEAEYVVRQIIAGVATRNRRPKDFAVLYRTNAQSRVLEEAFLASGIPYRIVAGLRFYERKEVKDAVAYLRLVQNPNDTVSLLRVINVPPRRIGQTTIQRISAYASESGLSLFAALAEADSIAGIQGPTRAALRAFHRMLSEVRGAARSLTVTQVLRMVLDRSGFIDALESEGTQDALTRLQNIEELFTVTQEFEARVADPSLEAFLEQLSLLSDTDTYDEQADSVALMTLHAAKGLEFPEVFLVGVEEGLLPFSRSLQDEDLLAEERRLCYVGMTRAKDRLYMVYARRRTLFGAENFNLPSRFLDDIPRELTNLGPPARRGRRMPAAPIPSDPSPAPTPAVHPDVRDGVRVRHPKFGEGVVVSASPMDSDVLVSVVFDDPAVGLKKLSLSYAKLEVLQR